MTRYRSLKTRLTPNVPEKVRTTFYWDASLRDQVEKIAQDHNRSLNAEVDWALRQYVAQFDLGHIATDVLESRLDELAREIPQQTEWGDDEAARQHAIRRGPGLLSRMHERERIEKELTRRAANRH